MKNKFLSPVEILSQELSRLNNDIDRLQMLITLKTRLNNLQFNSDNLLRVFSIFKNEEYRLQAIDQLIPFVNNDFLILKYSILIFLFKLDLYIFYIRLSDKIIRTFFRL